MRIFALSDIHVDYEVNARWIADLSTADYCGDLLILAGDVTDAPSLFEKCITDLARRFRQVLFVPGNHDLWVVRDNRKKHSLEKFDDLGRIVRSSGASMLPFHAGSVSIIPLFGWYDYSFGSPGNELRSSWRDYGACRWPDGIHDKEVAEHFEALNTERLRVTGRTTITFSHFLPRIDLMPAGIPPSKRYLYPVLGTTKLERQLRRANASVHVYGHSHVNRRKEIDGVTYVNNAFGYPSETRIAAKKLLEVYEF